MPLTPLSGIENKFSAFLEGAATAFVGPERIECQAGDYFLAGPGVAHWYEGTQYPVRYAAVYFHPSIAIEMGPVSDGLAILLRFGARQSLADPLFRPPPALKSRFRDGIDEMIGEFEQKEFGHEVRLRNIFMELLIQMLRWERKAGRGDTITGPGVSSFPRRRRLGGRC